jgi:putative protease
MTIHNLEGAKVAAAMGIRRIVLARELSGDEIAEICSKAPVEVEVFVHGALCMSYSGQCYMSAVIGRRSGNRGLCAQPCRLNYSTGGHDADYLLSLKDNCLIAYLDELEKMGVTSVKIEGTMKRPEYAAIVTGIYSRAIREGKPPTAEDMAALQAAFSRQGFTDGYYTDRKDVQMLGIREENDEKDATIFSTARKNYLNGEFQRVPVRFAGIIKRDEHAKLAARDDRGNLASAEGPVPEPAFHKELTQTRLQTQLYKTGGTPFYCIGVKGEIDRGLTLPVAAINEMRRDLLADLMKKRRHLAPRAEGKFEPGYRLLNSTEAPC